MDPTQEVQCADFLLFQANLKSMREVDDKIIHTLNVKLPAANFARAELNPSRACQELYTELLSTYAQRENAIKGCITFTSKRVKELAAEKEKNPDSHPVLKGLKKEQTKLRMLQSELNVEEVVKERSMKVFDERCRAYFKP